MLGNDRIGKYVELVARINKNDFSTVQENW